jgi:hypothetical protein
MQVYKFDTLYLGHDLTNRDSMLAPTSGKKSTARTGTDFVKWLTTQYPKGRLPAKIIIHSMNPVGAENMRQILQSAGINSTVVPFSQLMTSKLEVESTCPSKRDEP